MNLRMKKQGGGTLTLSGDLTIERSAALREILIKALAKTDQLEINLKKVIEVDLSCLQLFCSASRSFQDIQGDLKLKDNKVPDRFREILHEAGYVSQRCLSKDFCHQCLWREVI